MLEDSDSDGPVTFDQDRARNLFCLGPVGVGETFLACAVGHAACRAGRRVLFLRSGALLRLIHQSRAENLTESVVCNLLAPDLLIIDDFGLRVWPPSNEATSRACSR